MNIQHTVYRAGRTVFVFCLDFVQSLRCSIRALQNRENSGFFLGQTFFDYSISPPLCSLTFRPLDTELIALHLE